MADDSPNKARIQAMLDDLAKNRQGPPPGPPGGPPSNLPTGRTEQSAATPKPVPPPAPKPVPPSVPPEPPVRPPSRPAGPPPAPTAPAPSKPPAIPPRPPLSDAQAPRKAPGGSSTTTEVRTMSADVERLSTGQAPAPMAPSAAGPVKAPPTPTERPAGITVPERSSGGMGRKLMFGVIGLVVILGILYLVFSVLSGGEPEPTPTPSSSPTASATATPRGKDLSFYFGQLRGALTFMDGMDRQDIMNLITTVVPVAGTANNMEFRGDAGFPSVLKDAQSGILGTEGATLVFRQTEFFGPDGQLKSQASTAENRLIYVAEVLDATAANQLIYAWEANVEKDADLFDIDPSNALVQTFSDATYRQIPVRYRNFPYADQSIDWAIVPASNNRNYLVITNSRQSMFFAVDQLLK